MSDPLDTAPDMVPFATGAELEARSGHLRQVDVAKEDAPTWSVACIDSTWSTRRIQEACGR